MLGDVSKRRDSCSDSFFRRRSMTFEPLLALWNQKGENIWLCVRLWRPSYNVWKGILDYNCFKIQGDKLHFYISSWIDLSKTRFSNWTEELWLIISVRSGSVCIHATFSLWISLRRCEILTFMASSSSSGTWGMVSGSVSSGPWKVSSVKGMYHLLSYCWFLL